MAKISLIVPIYNVEKYLEKALDSTCKQTLKDIEIICIDDCSTDNSKEILETFALKDSRIKTIYLDKKHNQGYSRNIGINEAQGEYLMFLDSDDWLEYNACEVAYNYIKRHDFDIVAFNYYIYFEKNGQLRLKDYKNKSIFSAGIVWKNIYNTKFIKENDIQFGDLHHCEDNIFFIKSLILANSISFLRAPLYYYRKRANATSTTDTGEYCFETILAKEECYNIIQNYPENNFYLPGLAYTINTTLSIYKSNKKKIKKSSIKKEYFNMTKKLLTRIFNEVGNLNELKKKINTQDCKKIIKYNYEQYQVINLLEKFFSIYRHKEKLHLNILGIRIKI